MGVLHYGTSSFSEKSWVGSFYPRGLPPADFLRYYATQFATVEVDATYYAVPEPRMVRGWAEKVPDGFQLACKFPRSIVHGGDGPRPDGPRVLVGETVESDLGAFLGAMSELGDKLGPLVLQFPYFNRSAFPDRDAFLERLEPFLAALPDGYRYAVEVRNKAWLGPELLQVLRSHRAALCLVDLVYMPHPERLARGLDLVTTDFVYARLIGDRKAVDARTKTFDRIVLDQSARLERWSGLLRSLLEKVPDVYVFANNHYAGHGPSTIRDLAARVEGRAPPRGAPAPGELFG